MKKHHYLLIFGLMALCLFACRKRELSSVIDQDRVYIIYELSYNEFSDKTIADARFYLDSKKGKCLELSQNSRVFCDGVELEPPTKRSLLYTATLAGYADSSEFVWNDIDQRFFYNKIALPASIYAYNQSFGYWFSPAWGYDFYWEGNAIKKGESVTVSLKVDQDTSFTVTSTESREGRTFTHFSPNEAEMLMGRAAYVTVTRRRTDPIEEGTSAGGTVTTSYISEGSWLYGY